MIRVLNLYAGIGGNRKLWQDVQVTALEKDPKIAALYRKLHPQDEVIEADAHQYLLDNVDRFDFIWSSPPCQSHTKMMKATRHKRRVYPDMALYAEILFLQNFCKVPWVVENVRPYYRPFIAPSFFVGRHFFWAGNFGYRRFEKAFGGFKDVPRPANFINQCNLAGKRAMMEWLGLHYEENVYYGDNHCPAQVLRNCVHPEIGRQIFEAIFPLTQSKSS